MAPGRSTNLGAHFNIGFQPILSVSLDTYVCIFVCVCVCMYVYSDRDRDRDRQRQWQRQRGTTLFHVCFVCESATEGGKEGGREGGREGPRSICVCVCVYVYTYKYTHSVCESEWVRECVQTRMRDHGRESESVRARDTVPCVRQSSLSYVYHV